MRYTALLLAAAGSFALVTTSPALADKRGPSKQHRGVSQQQVVQKFIRAFDRLDRNGNGKVSMKEIRASQRRHNSRGRHGGEHGGRVSIGDENFRIVFTSGHAGRSSGPSNVGPINARTFRIYDLDRDGVIRRKELRRAVRIQFQRADRNGNGYLSQREQNQSRWLQGATDSRGPVHRPDYRRDRNNRR